jgi:riboflavin synthase
MFTGIIEAMGHVVDLQQEGTNVTFTLSCPFTNELKVDQSLAHNGVCLTVIAIDGDQYAVTAIDETLKKTNVGQLKVGSKVNLERCMPANGRFDGHIVQGHVDQTGVVTGITEQNGSWLFDFSYEPTLQNITVEKGSICINGTSLTVFNSEETSFRVAIIPYTYEHTVFHTFQVGDTVNLEFDIVGKYIRKMMGGTTALNLLN